jgi:Tat protein secretion system quality control protein TatD with DNase activity
MRDPSTQKLVQQLPLDNILLESDSPALPAGDAIVRFFSLALFDVPSFLLLVKQTRNEPKNILISAQEIARLKNCKCDSSQCASVSSSVFFSCRPCCFHHIIYFSDSQARWERF